MDGGPAREAPAAGAHATGAVGTPHEQLLLAAMQTSPDAFVVLDYADRVEWWNRAAERLFGWTREEAVGRLLTELVVPEEYRAAHDEGLRRRAAGGTPRLGTEPVQVEAVCRDGRRILVELSVGELEWEDGPRFHAFVRDVTDREDARTRLELSERRSRTVFESAPVGMLLVELDGDHFDRISAANRAASTMLGYTQDELRAMTCRAITHPDDRPLDDEMVPRLLTAQVDELDYEKRYVRRDGHVVWVAFSATVVRDVGGTALHSIHQLVDVTERRAAAEELVRLNEDLLRANTELAAVNEELDRFTSAVAHDLKNPITAISAHIDLLMESHDFGRGHRGAEAIFRAAWRMNALVEDLLSYSRAHGAALLRERTDLGAVVDDVAAELTVALATPVHITRGPLPSVDVAPTLFRQVVANVIGNGVKYVAPDVVPHVHVSAEEGPEEGLLTLRFVDNGIGISPEACERVFEVFHREATEYPGTGIGLATCRRIVERHGGRIWIAPAPTGGSVVSVQLPVDPG